MNNTNQTPFNALTGKAYQGGNIPELEAAMANGGYSDPRFMTFKQALEMGRCVRKGEKAAARVTRWFKAGEKNEPVEEEAVKPKRKFKGRMGSKSFAVFNIEQTDELPMEAEKVAA